LRNDRVSEVLARTLAEREQAGRWLVVDDLGGHVRAALPPETTEDWFRTGYGGRDARPGPPEGPFDGIALRLPRGRLAVQMTAHLLAARLTPAGALWVAGSNDEGIRSIPGRIGSLFPDVAAIDARRHCRVWRARGRDAPLRGQLADWATAVRVEAAGVALHWLSWPSLFAHGRLDKGTQLLLENVPPLSGRVLDFACGAGVVSQFLLRRGDPVTVDASDVDALAVHATRHNAPDVAVQVADGIPLAGGPWDTIVSNPPVHLGKDANSGALHALAATAPHRLARNGSLWIVVQGSIPVQRALDAAFTDVSCVAQAPGYRLWRATAARIG